MCERSFFLLPLISALLLCFVPNLASAQHPGGGSSITPVPTVADSACDPDYYDTLESRAWLEAQREITQNQNLILKPDSVLQYTCFDKHLGSMKNAATTMFTQGSNLNDVGQVAHDYVEANFTDVHTQQLGDRSNESNFLVANSVAQAYSCDEMAKIWQNARCMNFIDEPSSDGFFTLEEYAGFSQDVRFNSTVSPYCAVSSQWQPELDALEPANTAWEEDDVKTFLDEIDPEHPSAPNCGSSASFSTGIYVYSTHNAGTYFERSCLVLGCVYDADAGNCKAP